MPAVNLRLLDGTDSETEQSLPPTGIENTLAKVASQFSAEELLVKIVCKSVAEGESIQAVSNKIGLALADVQLILEHPKSQDMIVRFQAEVSSDPAGRIRKMTNMALDVQTRLLLDKKTPATVLAKLSNDLIDRNQGKAIQITENRNMNFEMKDADALDRALSAQNEKLRRIEELQKRLAVPVQAKEVGRYVPGQSALDKPHFISN